MWGIAVDLYLYLYLGICGYLFMICYSQFIIYYVCGYAVGMKSSVWGLIGILLHSAQSAPPFFLMHILHMSHESSVWNEKQKQKTNKTSGEKLCEYLNFLRNRISQSLNDIYHSSTGCHIHVNCSRWGRSAWLIALHNWLLSSWFCICICNCFVFSDKYQKLKTWKTQQGKPLRSACTFFLSNISGSYIHFWLAVATHWPRSLESIAHIAHFTLHVAHFILHVAHFTLHIAVATQWPRSVESIAHRCSALHWIKLQ